MPVDVFQQRADDQDNCGEDDKDEGDDGDYSRPNAKVGILEEVPPPLLSLPHAGVWENEHIVLLSLGGRLHQVLPVVVDLLAARLDKQLADAPVGQLLAERDRTRFLGTVKLSNSLHIGEALTN